MTVAVGGTSGDVTVDRSSLTFSTSNWGTPQTVTVSLAQDDDAADDAAVTLTHTPSGGDYGAVPFASVTVTPDDDDTAGATVTPTALAVTEGSTGTYTVALATSADGGRDGGGRRDLRGRHGRPELADLQRPRTGARRRRSPCPSPSDDDAADDAAVTLTHTPSGGGLRRGPVRQRDRHPDDDDTAGATVTPTALAVTEGSTSSGVTPTRWPLACA